MGDTKLIWTKVSASMFIPKSNGYYIFLALAKLELYHLCTLPHRIILRNSQIDKLASIP